MKYAIPIVRYRLLLLLWLFVGGCQGLTFRQPSEAPAASPPHIVVILADDLGWGDLAAAGPDSLLPTPSLERIAAGGIRCTDAHSPSSVCTPTRYGLLTGRYAWRTSLRSGVLGGRSPALISSDRATLPSVLADIGYRTSGIGKWHLGLQEKGPTNYSKPLVPGPSTVGFQRWWGIPASLDMEPYLYFEDDHAVQLPTEKIKLSHPARGGGEGFWRAGAIAPGFHHADVLPDIGQRAVSEIEHHHQQHPDEPMFLYVALSAPHTPWLPGDPFNEVEGAGVYGAFVAHVDAVVGEIDAALDRNDMAEQTLLIVTSDNGAHWTPADVKKFPHRANGPWRGQKADIHEGGHRVPFLMRWPDRIASSRQGKQYDGLICLTDLLPTLAKAAGMSLPKEVAPDGFDLLSSITKGDPSRRRSIVHHSLDGMFAVRQGPWKWIEGRGSGGFTAPKRVKDSTGPVGQLYHLGNDPKEKVNLADSHPDVVADLQAELDRIRTSGSR
ncbi:MAG: arylsulfatase [Planctomycetota bacterium]